MRNPNPHPNPNPSLFVKAFAALARPMMLPCMDPSARGRSDCIGSSRAAFEALRIMGLRAKPWAVSWIVSAEKFNFAYMSGVRGKTLEEFKNGAANYRTRPVENGPGWSGHLVLIVEDRWIIDPSFDQCSAHPEMNIPPTILVIDLKDPAYLASAGKTPPRPEESHIQLGIEMKDGLKLEVWYWPLKDNSWRKSEVWNDNDAKILGQFIALKVMNAVSKAMDAASAEESSQ